MAGNVERNDHEFTRSRRCDSLVHDELSEQRLLVRLSISGIPLFRQHDCGHGELDRNGQFHDIGEGERWLRKQHFVHIELQLRDLVHLAQPNGDHQPVNDFKRLLLCPH